MGEGWGRKPPTLQHKCHVTVPWGRTRSWVSWRRHGNATGDKVLNLPVTSKRGWETTLADAAPATAEERGTEERSQTVSQSEGIHLPGDSFCYQHVNWHRDCFKDVKTPPKFMWASTARITRNKLPRASTKAKYREAKDRKHWRRV